MYLSKLEIFGFKSFAQKAVFQFDDGLTGIIGPNGCGKSNIVDAIRWVLGEQRPTVLRCDKMDNLIFNGTATRKPIGAAEVSLYIENNKNILPSEYTEIKISRRLFRSGESEYLINNQPVRLMDITNLFADTGMGADAYSIIELKMVEQILSDNAQERRRLFEEASGIKKYKARRKSALNKLEATQQELTRLEDILAEVQKSVNSLSRQVGKARRYLEYKDALKEKELSLSYLKIHSYRHQLEPLGAELKEVSNSRDTLATEVRGMEAELEKLQARGLEFERQYREKAAELYRKDEAIQELQNRRELRRQRAESLQEAQESYRREISQQHEKLEQLAQERRELATQLKTLIASKDAAQQEYRDCANRQLEAEAHYSEARDQYQAFVQANLSTLQEPAAAREEHQKICFEVESLSAQMDRQSEQAENLRRDLKSRAEELAALQKESTRTEKDAEIYRQELEQVDRRLEDSNRQRELLRNEINAIEGQVEKARNRREFLENLIRNYEGFSQSVQYVMSHRQEYQGVQDTLANLVDCQPQFRPALESFLSEISNYLVVDEVETAQRILAGVRSQGSGRLTVVPLQLLAENHRPPVGEIDGKGIEVVPLKKVVSYPAEYEKLFGFLFNAVFLVPDLSAAIAMRQTHPQLTFITREGDILEHWGNITSGAAGNGAGLIGRQEQLQQATAALEQQQAELTARQEALHKLDEELGRLESQRQEFLQLQKSIEEEQSRQQQLISRHSYEISRMEETLQTLHGEIDERSERLKQLKTREKALQPELQKLEARRAAYQKDEKQLLEKQQQAETQLKQLTAATQEKQIHFLNLTSRENELRQKEQFIDESCRQAESFVAGRHQKIDEGQQRIDQLKEEDLEIGKELEEAYRQRDLAEAERNETEKQFQELKNVILTAETELKKKQRLWNQARERLQELELHMRELEVKLAGVEEQVAEKYGRAALQFDIGEMDPALTIPDVQGQIDELRSKIESLGDVNPLAIKEHEKEKERLDFLNGQKSDLLSARDQLLETIEKLNSTARKQFMDTFEKIQVNFQKVFKEFFEDGEGELRLVESRDPLEANIDISVVNKGKKLNTLSLLSAGEKTLTAISMLFAIYLVKPSPFCILDEVDAPLDDVNISRFTRALRLFAHDTQFILVTHNKRTMEATASMYGITMEEQGVSKVVSVRLE